MQQETFERGTAIPPGDEHHGPIQVKGRLHHGMAFAGDEVRVKVHSEGFTEPLGHVVSVFWRGCRQLAFVCCVDEWDPAS